MFAQSRFISPLQAPGGLPHDAALQAPGGLPQDSEPHDAALQGLALQAPGGLPQDSEPQAAAAAPHDPALHAAAAPSLWPRGQDDTNVCLYAFLSTGEVTTIYVHHADDTSVGSTAS